MTSLVLLSAGLSTRFGSPKALAPWGDKPLITHLQDTLLPSGLDEIVVVLGAFAEEIKPLILKHKKVKVVYNKDYKLGQTSSFKAGLRAVAPKAQGVGLLPVDLPLVKTETVSYLLEEFSRCGPGILIPSYRAKKGHPPFFNMSLKKEILALSDDTGLNTLFPRHAAETRVCEVNDEGVILTFNTPLELSTLRKKND